MAEETMAKSNATIPEVVNKRFKECREYCHSDWQAMNEAAHFFASMCASMARCHFWEDAEFWAKCELEACTQQANL